MIISSSRKLNCVVKSNDIVKLRDRMIIMFFYLSTAMGFYGILVYTPLLIISSSDKIQKIIPIHTVWFLIIGIPLFLLGGLLFGWFLDRVVGYNSKMAETSTLRNPQIIEILKTVKKLEKDIEQLKKTKIKKD